MPPTISRSLWTSLLAVGRKLVAQHLLYVFIRAQHCRYLFYCCNQIQFVYVNTHTTAVSLHICAETCLCVSTKESNFSFQVKSSGDKSKLQQNLLNLNKLNKVEGFFLFCFLVL